MHAREWRQLRQHDRGLGPELVPGRKIQRIWGHGVRAVRSGHVCIVRGSDDLLVGGRGLLRLGRRRLRSGRVPCWCVFGDGRVGMHGLRARCYTGSTAQSSCALSSGGYYVAAAGATAPSQCASGRYSGTGSSFCSICPLGTTSDVGSSTCTTSDAGYIAPSAEIYAIAIDSSLVVAGVNADDFNGDYEAQDEFKDALESVLVETVFSDLVDDEAVLISTVVPH